MFRAVIALAVGSLLLGCAGELEDEEEYTTRIRPGLGASGVLPAQGVSPTKPEPSVQPQTSKPPEQTADDETSSEVGPTPSVAPTSGEPSTGLSEECANVPTRILQSKCAGISCHGEPGTPTTTFSDIASSTNPMLLLDVPAKYTCSSKMLIDSQTPADSAILSVVQEAGHCSGGRMPSGGPYLSADEIRCLTEWVTAVATGAI